MKLTTLIKYIDDFLFKPTPVHNVAFLRIGFGILLLFNWFMIFADMDTFFGPNGLISLSTAQQYGNQLRFSLFDYLPHTEKVTTTLAIINLIAVVGMTIGFWTKTSIAVAFITLISFHHRNGFILNSADSVLRVFLFLMFFTHCADMFSVDRWMKLQKGKAALVPEEKSPWALRMIQIQFCIIYIATVMFKLKGERWIDGSAIYVATRLDDFVRFEFPLLNNLILVKWMTWGTLAVEIALGTLVWIKELRYWVLLAGIGLHLGIEYTMAIPVFEWAMIVLMISMVDPHDLKKVWESFKDKQLQRLSRKQVTV
ncbi:HTTM domain-containing protein [Bdellovibrio reynosensis]|uniref:HTTM domain-containing protein n=1 Tax=Bdellovibrio reynosensis TaxID=2835041 RepID=A0ABY4C8P5_9BACT|nr:HTTM domain-containing protein [Bdellovibrio reynosensis]UOF01248.1 HTTM domain-containing protein [Bdellovibrio reynosensis]